jgi:hypothetical protein
MQEWVNRKSFLLFTLVWLLLFFPQWYVLSYTKVRELRSMVFQSKEVQLQVLHPAGEMTQLLELKHVLATQFSDKKIAFLSRDRLPNIPLATDTSVIRAVFYPLPVLSKEELTDEELIIYIEDRSKSETCVHDVLLPSNFEGEVLCWPIL